jgi:hypothetical protein
MTDEIGTVPGDNPRDDEVTDVLAEDEVVHVQHGNEELAESLDATSTFLPDVPHWDEPDE